MYVPKYEVAFLIKAEEIFFLTSNFLFKARKIAKKILRFNPRLHEAIILKKGIEKEWFYSPSRSREG